MPNGESKNWIRFCGAIDGFRANYKSWPNRVRVPNFFIEELRTVLSPESFAKLESKIFLITDNKKLDLVKAVDKVITINRGPFENYHTLTVPFALTSAVILGVAEIKFIFNSKLPGCIIGIGKYIILYTWHNTYRKVSITVG